MSQLPKPAQSLRVRKLERTRASLIDAAIELCLSRGYEDITVEQIVAAADVSARTFSRYFPTKVAVFVTVLDDLADEVARELRSQVLDVGPLESMRAALGSVLTRTRTTSSHSTSAAHITRIISVVTASPTLRQAAIDYRGPQVMEAMAERMNVTVEDPRLAQAMTLISVTVVHAWGELAAAGGSLEPQLVAEQIDQAFADLATYAADLVPARSRSHGDHDWDSQMLRG